MGGRHVVRMGAALLALLAAVTLLGVVQAPSASAGGPPINDAFVNAQAISGSGTISASNFEATMQSGEPNHGGTTAGAVKSVWYSYTPTTNGTLTVETCNGTSLDTVMAAYTGTTVGTLNHLAGSDDDCGGGTSSRITFPTLAGTTYRIAVAAYANPTNGITEGVFLLTWSFVAAPPANDAFASPQAISGATATGSTTGTNVSATLESGEPNHAGATGASGRTVWYAYTTSSVGTLAIDTCAAASFNTTIAVYAGSSVTALTPLASNDDAAGCSGGRSRVHVPVSSGTVYRIAVAGEDGASGTFTLSWNRIQVADTFAQNVTITGATGSHTATTLGATLEAGEPDHAGATGGSGRTVWYRYIPAENGMLTVDTCTAADFDTIVASYVGSAVNALTPVADSNDACGVKQSRIQHQVTAGTTYRLAVAGTAGAAGSYTLSWNLVPSGPTPPANDDFADAQTITGATCSAPATTTGATVEPGDPTEAYEEGIANNIWYSYTAPSTGTLVVGACTTNFSNYIAAVQGGTLNGLTKVADDLGGCDGLGTDPGSTMTFPVTEGTTYRFVVFGYGGQTGDFTLAWTLTPAAPSAPANDAFADAQTISGATGSGAGTTVAATFETGEPNHAGETQPNGRSVWYRYTAASNGSLTIDTCTGTDFDSIIAVYTGSAVNALTQRAAGDQDCLLNNARATLAVTAGTTYRIAVAGYQGDAGAFTLSWSLVPTPANDAFASAQTLSGASGSVDGTTVGASFETGEPTPFDYDGLGPSVWYRYTAPATGQLTVETCGAASFDTMLGAYTGTAVNALTERAEGDDECASLRTRITFAVTAGTTYRIAVTGGNGSTGTFTLAWDLVPTGPSGPTFTDVGTSHPFYADIEWMATEEISTGYQPGPTYRPGAAVTRQAMSAFMYRLAGEPAFSPPGNPTFGDVNSANPFYAEIEWMAAEDITTGTPASPKPLYKPSAPVSRGAMSAFMYRLAGEPTFSPPAANATTFGDVAASHPFYAEIEWMAAEDITTGTPGSPKPTYKPANPVSRGAMSAFMHRLADGPGVDLSP